MDLGEQPMRWFRGGRLNTCFNALDRHVRDGRGDQYRAPAIDPGAAYWGIHRGRAKSQHEVAAAHGSTRVTPDDSPSVKQRPDPSGSYAHRVTSKTVILLEDDVDGSEAA